MLQSHRTGEKNTDAKGKEEGKKFLYTKQRQWHIDPEVRFIDACVALGLVRETVEPSERARGKEVVEVNKDTARKEEE